MINLLHLFSLAHNRNTTGLKAQQGKITSYTDGLYISQGLTRVDWVDQWGILHSTRRDVEFYVGYIS